MAKKLDAINHVPTTIPNSALLIKKVSQRITPSEDFLYGGNSEFQDAAITYCLFFSV